MVDSDFSDSVSFVFFSFAFDSRLIIKFLVFFSLSWVPEVTALFQDRKVLDSIQDQEAFFRATDAVIGNWV